MLRFVAVFVLTTLLFGAATVSATVRVERATTKVLPADLLAGGLDTAVVEAARGEWEGFQVVIAATDGAIEGVDVTLGDLQGPDGAVVLAGAAEIYLESYVEITHASACDPVRGADICNDYPPYQRLPGSYPEQLVPLRDPYSLPPYTDAAPPGGAPPVAAPFDVPAGTLQTLFVDLLVPTDAAAGEYAGTLTVTAGGAAIAEIPVQLRVWDFTLPAERHVATSYGFSANLIYNYHGGADPDDATRARIARNYELAMHAHRIDRTTLNPGLSIGADAEGKLLPIDFTAYDAYLGPRIDGSFYPDGAGVNRFNVGMFRPGHGMMGLPEAAYSQAAKVLAEHLQERGWLEHAYLYSTDEPWAPTHSGAFDRIAHDAALLYADTDLWRGHALVTGPWDQRADPWIDIWCPVTAMYDNDFWPEGSFPPRAKYAELLAEGDELWFYVCNANFPPMLGYDTDSPLGYEPRLTKWGAWYEGATGFLYWRVNYWLNPEPWTMLANWDHFGDIFARNGDGILIFPGDHDGKLAPAGSPEGVSIDGPVVSYRLKQIRDGLEDWELFILASDLGAGDYARAQVERAYHRFGRSTFETGGFDFDDHPWTHDPEVMLDARRNVALKVQYLTHPDAYADPEAPPEPDPSPEVEPDADTSDSGISAPDEADEQPKKKDSGCTAAGPGASGFGALLLAAVLAVLRRS